MSALESLPLRELDYIVAREVFGCKLRCRAWTDSDGVAKQDYVCGCNRPDGCSPHNATDEHVSDCLAWFSDDWRAAGEVIEKLKMTVGFQTWDQMWWASDTSDPGFGDQYATAQTGPHAVAIAAVMLVRAQETQP